MRTLLLILFLPIFAFASERVDIAKSRFDSTNLREATREVKTFSSGVQSDRARLDSYKVDSLANVLTSREIAILKRLKRMVYQIDERLIYLEIPKLELPSFTPNEYLKLVTHTSNLIATYPEAWREQNSVNDFSYFGFLKQDLEEGLISYEQFLEELQNYIISTKRTNK